MSIVDKLNSGALHRSARLARPDCVDLKGNIHASPERARFVSWVIRMKKLYGSDARTWPEIARAEYRRKYVSS